MKLEHLQEQIYNSSNRHRYSSLDDLILEIVNSYAKEMCIKQIEVCIDAAERINDGNEDIDSVIKELRNVEFPKELN
jgi:hypothetical protein